MEIKVKVVGTEHITRPGKFTQEQLEAGFNEVSNKENWKYAIDTVIPAPDDEKRVLLVDAVAHFTGSLLEFIQLPDQPGYVRAVAAGYYATIGS